MEEGKGRKIQLQEEEKNRKTEEQQQKMMEENKEIKNVMREIYEFIGKSDSRG